MRSCDTVFEDQTIPFEINLLGKQVVGAGEN